MTPHSRNICALRRPSHDLRLILCQRSVFRPIGCILDIHTWCLSNPVSFPYPAPCGVQADGKLSSAFNRPLRSPSSFLDVSVVAALSSGLEALAVGSPPPAAESLLA